MNAINATDKRYRGSIGYNRWTLCIGTGASAGIVPSWQEFTRRAVNEAFSSAYSEAEFRHMVFDSGWGLDSWIQAAANHYTSSGRSRADFNKLIETLLYSDLLGAASAAGVEDILKEILHNPRSMTKRQVGKLAAFFTATHCRINGSGE